MRRPNHSLVARTRMLVGTTSNFITYEVLVVVHVLCTLDGGELDDIHVHSIEVMMRGRQQLVSSKGNIRVIARTQLLESLGDIKELTSLGEPVLVCLRLIFQRHHLEGPVNTACLNMSLRTF